MPAIRLTSLRHWLALTWLLLFLVQRFAAKTPLVVLLRRLTLYLGNLYKEKTSKRKTSKRKRKTNKRTNETKNVT